MNLKLNGSAAGSTNLLRKPAESVKEERRRTGRYIAILVGICLLMLAMYHAWVRRIPVVASLVVPALIMFVYVGWVLYTASRDKHKLMLLDAEAALAASPETTERDVPFTELNNLDIISKDKNTPDSSKHWPELSSLLKGDPVPTNLTKPIILINDKLPEDQDLRWTQIVEIVTSNDKLKGQTRRKFKRKFCRSKRHAHFKRSYSIA